MKTFTNQAAQGDVLFRRVDKIPAGFKAVKAKGPVVVAESETHHHHSFDANAGVQLFQGDDPMIMFMKVSQAAVLKHHRDFDTHEALQFEKGTYEIRRQREWSPEGFRRVDD